MSLQINSSPDITLLSVQILYDLSGVTPAIVLTNLSEGDDLADVSYAFIIKSPTTTYIHEGDINTPDETGIWITSNVLDPWPRPFNQIEFGIYTFQVIAKDSNGTVYTAPIQYANICRPNGNTKDSKNTYGVGSVTVQTKCDQARIFFQDTTNSSYKGIEGTVGSSVLRVNFPMDNTGVVPAPFQINYFATAMVPITFSGKGYQFLYTSIYDYDLGDDVHVRIKYLKNDTFGVWCNIDLMPLVCEFEKLSRSLSEGTCTDIEQAQNKMNLITPKFFELLIGVSQPLTGVDVPFLIEEIKEIGGFDCDCCNAATGIVPTGSSSFDGYTFSVVSEGGDIGGEVVANGFNIQFLLNDVKYIVKICDGSPSDTTAFEFIPSVSGDGYTKTYCLSVDVTQFGYDLGNAISSNADLLNFWQALFASSGGALTLIVDGDCIFSSSSTCDYELTLSNIPSSATFAMLTGIRIGSTNTSLVYSFNLTNLAGLQTYLNSLGFGTFAVSNPSGQTVLITSAANGNDIQQLSYKISATNYLADLSKTCDGFVPISANEVVQNIISYICNFTDSQLVTSAEYQICYLDPDTGAKTISTVASGEALTTFITELLARGCDTIDYIVSLSSVDCAAILAQFPSSINAMQASDIFFSTKAGACSQVTPNEAFLTMLTYGQFNSDVLLAFCNMVNLCAGGNPCAPYDIYYVTVDPGSPTSTIDLIVTFDHPDAVSNTIRYARIDNTSTPVFITIPGVLPGASPYTISGLDNGQYRVYIRPVYADGRLCSETVFDTPVCGGITSFSVAYDGVDITASYTAEVGLDSVRFNISYPNGGSFSQIYANGDPIVVTPPASVYGTFFATLQPVCEPSTGFFGTATAPATFIINPPYNSSLINNSDFNQDSVGVFTGGPTLLQIASQPLDIGGNIPFYIGDGLYGLLYVRVDNEDRDYITATLVTGTGTYIGTPNGPNYLRYTNINILGGVTITLTTDSSPAIPAVVSNNSAGDVVIDGVDVATVAVTYIEGDAFPLSGGEVNVVQSALGTATVDVTISGLGSPVAVRVTGSDGVLQSQAGSGAGVYSFTGVVINANTWRVETV